MGGPGEWAADIVHTRAVRITLPERAHSHRLPASEFTSVSFSLSSSLMWAQNTHLLGLL